MNNSLYGASFKDKQKYRKGRLVTTVLELQRELKKPNFVEFEILSGDLVYVKLTQITFEEDAMVGMAFGILDYAKLCFYKLPYKLGEVCGNDITLLYSDTDSITVGYLKPNYKEAIKALADEFLDLSSLPPSD